MPNCSPIFTSRASRANSPRADEAIAVPFRTASPTHAAEPRQTARAEYEQLASQLSPREDQVYQLLLQGRENKQIALLLKISSSTVEKHRLAVVRKMQTENVVQLLIQKFQATGTLWDDPVDDSLEQNAA